MRTLVTTTHFRVSTHAARRYVERFAGNITVATAMERLQRIVTGARRKRPAPGGATIYATKGIEFVVKRGVALTVYAVDTKPTTPYALEA